MFFSCKPRHGIRKLIHIRVKYLSLYFPFYWFVRYLADDVRFQKKAKSRSCHLGLGCQSQPFVFVLMINLVTCLMPKECCLLLFTETVVITFFLISLQITENTEKSEKMISVLCSNQSYTFDN